MLPGSFASWLPVAHILVSHLDSIPLCSGKFTHGISCTLKLMGRTVYVHLYESMGVCVSYSSQCYSKILGKSFLRKKGFILAQRLKVQSIMVKKAWWQDLRIAVCIASWEAE